MYNLRTQPNSTSKQPDWFGSILIAKLSVARETQPIEILMGWVTN